MNNVDYNDDIKIGVSVSATPDTTPTVKVYAGGVLIGAATVAVSTGIHDYVAEFTMPSSSFLESPVDGLVISVRVDSVVNAVQLPSEYKQIGMFGLHRLQAIASSAQLIADDVATNAAAAGLHATTDGLITTVDTVVDSILVDTNELQTDWADGGRLDLLLDATLAMLDDARAEPGQGAPAVNPDAMTKIDYLYKAWRNSKTQTATTFSLYNDAGTIVDQKATVSDDGTTATVGEIVTGP